MAKKDKKDKKDRKEKKDKKDRSNKKRKRDSSDSDDDRGQKRLEQEADRLTAALRKGTTEAFATDDGQLQLGSRFVWKKKIESELQGGAKTKDIYEREKKNTEAERRAEIEKVQKRREDREQEKEQREKEQDQLARDRAVAEAVELEKKEDEFHLENAKARATQRLREGREKPIDLLARDLMLGDTFPVGKEAPYLIFDDMPLSEVKEIREEILEYQELDSKDEEHAAWWDSLVIVCDQELSMASRQQDADRARLRGYDQPEVRRLREVGVHSAVDAQISELLSGQTFDELLSMEEEIKDNLESGDLADPEFHSAILRRMVLHKARARLRELHAALRARSLAQADQKTDVPKAMGWREEYVFGSGAAVGESPGEEEQQDGVLPPVQPAPSIVAEEADEEEEEEGGVRPRGQWSPLPLEPEEYAGQLVVPEEEDAQEILALRQKALQDAAMQFKGSGLPRRQQSGDASTSLAEAGGNGQARARPEPEGTDADTLRFKAAAANSMGDMNEAGDAPFGGEVQMESKVYWWHEKYRPRKPKYYNRVHTGYEWNKYNQTHYDHDKPPPKVVQGYKFNIFYPDLISRKEAPEYTIEKDPEADEFGSTCVLRFHAGPPYEDLTFRILNREWEYSHKKGFKCVFDRDTLYLYFNFKRQRYRR